MTERFWNLTLMGQRDDGLWYPVVTLWECPTRLCEKMKGSFGWIVEGMAQGGANTRWNVTASTGGDPLAGTLPFPRA